MSISAEMAVKKLIASNAKKVEVIASLAPQTNSMMYADYFVPNTISTEYDTVRGYVVKDSIDLKTNSLFVRVERKDRNDSVDILCDLKKVYILNIEK